MVSALKHGAMRFRSGVASDCDGSTGEQGDCRTTRVLIGNPLWLMCGSMTGLYVS